MRLISKQLLNGLLQKAQCAKRRRLNYNFHQVKEKVQRMLNAVYPDSYIPPHRHKDPDKVEVFIALYGRLIANQFDDKGKIIEQAIFGLKEKILAVEIQPGTWHNFVALEPSVVFEIIEGPYDSRTHKKIAPWAPQENDEESINKFTNKLKLFKNTI